MAIPSHFKTHDFQNKTLKQQPFFFFFSKNTFEWASCGGVHRGMLAIIYKEPSDPSTFIMPIDGHSCIWTGIDFSKVIEKMSYNTSSYVLFKIFNRV